MRLKFSGFALFLFSGVAQSASVSEDCNDAAYWYDEGIPKNMLDNDYLNSPNKCFELDTTDTQWGVKGIR